MRAGIKSFFFPAAVIWSVGAILGIGTILGTGCLGLKPAPKFRSPPSSAQKPAVARTPDSSSPLVAIDFSEFRQKLDRRIRYYLGTPYQLGGESRAGMDCSGLVKTVFREAVGIDLPRTSKQQYRLGTVISKGELKFGDLLFFEMDGSGLDHVGIYYGKGLFVHASTAEGVILAYFKDDYFQKRFVGIRRIARLR
ncbi:C40 family peptidase [candidate division KSB1 bacterium]|nr:C40 family peptidase [candidate division KSB1 bacterium]